MRIALAGNPNSGKTTLFNTITGKIEYVGNWPGVTIAKKEGDVKKVLYKQSDKIRIVDLPGAYSLAPFTSEENITSEFVKNEKPDVIVNIVDASNLSRSLFFTTQLLELGIPLVVALNKSDLLKKKGITVNSALLAQKLGCPVVETISTGGIGLVELIEQVVSVSGNKQENPFQGFNLEASGQAAGEKSKHERFAFVDQLVKEVEVRKVASSNQTIQDAVDRIIAHRLLGIPIFAAVIYLVFSLSQTYLGPLFADYLVGWIDNFYEYVASMIGADVSPVLSALLLDGIIGGVGAVMGFLPLIMVLFFLLALLEDSGYMARVAVVMDRYLKRVGLSGKSIIPMVIGTGCAIPGVCALLPC